MTEKCTKGPNATDSAQFATLPLVKPLFHLCALSSTDIPVLLPNQPNTYILRDCAILSVFLYSSSLVILKVLQKRFHCSEWQHHLSAD